MHLLVVSGDDSQSIDMVKQCMFDMKDLRHLFYFTRSEFRCI